MLTCHRSPQEFDPASDSITYLFLLRIQIQALQEASRDTLPDLSPSGAVWLRAKRYLEIFDSVQVRYAGLEWRQLVEFIARAAQNASQVGIPPSSTLVYCHDTDLFQATARHSTST